MISRSQSATAALTALAMPTGSSGSIGRQCATAPASRACTPSISELVSRIWPGPVGAPMGRTSSPVGRTATTGLRRTSRWVAPAAAAAARSTARSRWPSGSSSSAVLTSSPIDRTC